MARANIIVPDDLLEQIDTAATQDHLSRSGWLQDAARAYLNRRRHEREAVERTATMQKAVQAMDRLSHQLQRTRMTP